MNYKYLMINKVRRFKIFLFFCLFFIFLFASIDLGAVSLKEKMKPWRDKVRELIAIKKGYVYKLTHPDPDTLDDSEDSQLIKEAISRYLGGKWTEVNEILKKIMKEYPDSPHTERAYFLFALSTENDLKHKLPIDYLKIVKTFRTAMNKYKKSYYTPHANVSVGDIFYEQGKYYDAILYYSLADRAKPFKMKHNTLLRLGIANQIINQKDKSIKYFDRVIDNFPKSPSFVKAKTEKAKILFQKQSYVQSQKLLDEVMESHPKEIYINPDVLLYSGYNHYEMEEFHKARFFFSKVINLYPNIDSNHLILTRIADIFSEEQQFDKAVGLYNKVLNAYPGTDGSLISALRLVQLVHVDKERRYNETFIPEITYNKLPVEMYENIINNHMHSPLAHLAILKMAMKKFEQKDYEGTLVTLKSILDRYPDTPLRQDVRSAIRSAVNEMCQRDYKEKKYEKVITLYNRYQDYITTEHMSGSFMILLGNSYMELDLYRRAFDLYQNAKKFFLLKDRPADLWHGLGLCYFYMKKIDDSKEYFNGFIERFPDDPRIPDIYYKLGQIQYDNKEYEKAIYTFEIALKGSTKEVKLHILMMMGRSLRISKRYNRAVKVLQQRVELFDEELKVSKEDVYHTYYELGESYFKLGDKKNAAFAFEKALNVAEKGQEFIKSEYKLAEQEFIRTEYRLAECYHHLQVVDKAKKVLKSIIEKDDPFWSKVAKSKMEEIEMNQTLAKFDRKS